MIVSPCPDSRSLNTPWHGIFHKAPPKTSPTLSGAGTNFSRRESAMQPNQPPYMMTPGKDKAETDRQPHADVDGGCEMKTPFDAPASRSFEKMHLNSETARANT